eukprot:6394529-Prymnesium_polylepis.1
MAGGGAATYAEVAAAEGASGAGFDAAAASCELNVVPVSAPPGGACGSMRAGAFAASLTGGTGASCAGCGLAPMVGAGLALPPSFSMASPCACYHLLAVAATDS